MFLPVSFPFQTILYYYYFYSALRSTPDLKKNHKYSADLIIALTPNLFPAFYPTFTGSKQLPHLFICCRLLSAEISPMNIHPPTSGEPRANQMSNPGGVFHSQVGSKSARTGQRCGFNEEPVKRLHCQGGVFARKWCPIHIYAAFNNPLSPRCTCRVVNAFKSCTLSLHRWTSRKMWYDASLPGTADAAFIRSCPPSLAEGNLTFKFHRRSYTRNVLVKLQIAKGNGCVLPKALGCF